MSAELRAEFRVGSKDVARDMQRVTDIAQRETARAFRGGGMQGILSSPKNAIAGIFGSSGDVKRHFKTFRDIAIPEIKSMNDMLSRKSFFNRSITGLSQPNYARALAGIHGMGAIPFNHMATPPVLPAQQSLLSMAGKIVGITSVIGLTIKAFHMLIDAVKSLAHGILQAYANASKLYAKSLESGLGVSYVQNRSSLAGILGVSEESVYRFSKAVAYLNPKLQFSNRIFSETNSQLTATDWGFKVLGVDLKAMFAVIANELAPSIRLVTSLLDNMVKGFTVLVDGLLKTMKGLFSEAIPAILKTIFPPTLVNAFGPLAKAFLAVNGEGAPAPQSFMKQLGASSLEHMGLVMGGGANNPARETAKNTKKTNELLTRIVGSMKGGNTNINPFSVNQAYQ